MCLMSMSDYESSGLIIAAIIIFIILVGIIIILIVCHRNRSSPCYPEDHPRQMTQSTTMETLPPDIIAQLNMSPNLANLDVRNLRSYDSIMKDKLTLPPDYDSVVAPSYEPDNQELNPYDVCQPDDVEIAEPSETIQVNNTTIQNVPDTLVEQGITNPAFTSDNNIHTLS